MRRVAGLGLAAVLVLGIVSAPAQAKPKKVKVATETFIDDADVDFAEDTLTFTGHVTCERRKCVKRRNVRLRETFDGIDAGSDRTDENGNWEIVVPLEVTGGGSFEATAEKKKLKKKRNGEVKKVLKCLADTSEPHLIVT